MITGIPSGKYSRSEKNKSSALEAVELIRGNLSLLDDVKKLWEKVMERVGDVGKMPNSHMEVVIALWNASLISTA